MLKQSIRQLLANRTRLALTSLAIIISVAFTAAAFILTDGYERSFNGWATARAENTHVVVTPETPFDTGINFTFNPERMDAATLDQIRSVEGVADARPIAWVDNLVRPMTPAGTLLDDKFIVSTYGWVDDDVSTMVEGTVPMSGEFVIDVDSAETNGYSIGDSYDVTTPIGTQRLALAGIMRVGENNDVSGQVRMAVATTDLEAWTEPGSKQINVTANPGVDHGELSRRLGAELSDDLLVRTAVEADEAITSQIAPVVTGFRAGFLGFAAISVFVSAFIIYNTFNVLLGQRTREIGLLRAIGAGPKQIRRAIRIEALVLGVVASLIGLIPGIGLASLLGSFMRTSGGLPKTELVLAPRTFIISVAVGILMTVAGASAPARRACRVPVMVALRDGLVADTSSSKRRVVGGVGLLAVGIIAATAGLLGTGAAATTGALLGLGAVTVFLGVALLNPVWLRRGTDILGWPLARLFGVPGRVARQNVGRNPGRSATTAASLMIGLALVSMVLVVGNSAKGTVSSGAEDAYLADHIITNTWGYPFPGSDATDLEALDVVDRVVALSIDTAEVDGNVQPITIGPLENLGELINLEVTDGTGFDAAVTDPVLVTRTEADARGLEVGDRLPLTFLTGEARELTVIGVHDNNTAGGNRYLIDTATWKAATGQDTVNIMTIGTAADASADEVERAFTGFEAAHPQVEVMSIDDHVKSVGGEIDAVVTGINLMMVLAVLIAFAGIANTLVLSAMERTKELGLLRAVGMSRRQLRRMVRYEALLISLFGAALGAGLGIAFGAASVVALPATLVESIAIPVPQIVILTVIAAVAGVLAAASPAWRISRRRPLELITA